MVKYFQEIKNFQRDYYIIIIEWKKQTERIYLLTKEKKLLLINKKKDEFSLTVNEGDNVCAATLTFVDKLNNYHYRYVGDAYWNSKKNRYVALLWRYGNSGMLLPRKIN